jgi:hypothetical protein
MVEPVSYADLAALKAYLRLDDADTTDDTELQRSLDSASREIDQLCSRTFTVAVAGLPADRGYHYDVPHWDKCAGAWVVEIPDLTEPGESGLEVFLWDGVSAFSTTPVTLGAHPFRPLNNAPTPYPWTQIVLPADSGYAYAYGDAMASTVLVRADFGWAEVPAPVEEATLIQAARIHRRRDALFGIVNSPDGSSQTRLKAAMDPDVLILLDGLIKRWGAR